MDGLTRLKALSFLALAVLAHPAMAQRPAQSWFNPDPAAPALPPPGGPLAGPQPGIPQIMMPQQAFGSQPVNSPDEMGVAPAAMNTNIYEQPPSLEQQLAGLGKRIEALEKPPVKYPSNVQVLGVFQADGVTFNQDAASKLPIAAGGVGQEIQNGADFRRARLAARAALGNNMNAFMQFDFAFPGRPTFTDLWVEWTDLPVLGTVRVGQWKQPFSLEVVSSFRYTTFMERSSLFQTFTPFRHIGIGAYDHADDLMSTWAASYLRTGQDQFGDSLSTRGGNGFTGRITRLAWYDEEAGRSYLHLGADYYLNVPPNHAIAFRSIPEIFVGQNRNDAANSGSAGFAVPLVFDGTPFFVNTGNLLNVDHVHTFDLEALWVHGPLSVQAEAMAALVDRTTQSTGLLHGEYVQVGWFLTGEHRPYDRVAGAIDRVRPFEDFFLVNTDRGLERGKGAWEVAVRYSHLDLDDANISGGVMDNVTFGVNWYTNAYCKVVFNYIHSWRQSPTSPPSPAGNGPLVAVASEANAFGIRTQMDF
jgi:phosphate-selective porin OprO/OprP